MDLAAHTRGLALEGSGVSARQDSFRGVASEQSFPSPWRHSQRQNGRRRGRGLPSTDPSHRGALVSSLEFFHSNSLNLSSIQRFRCRTKWSSPPTTVACFHPQLPQPACPGKDSTEPKVGGFTARRTSRCLVQPPRSTLFRVSCLPCPTPAQSLPSPSPSPFSNLAHAAAVAAAAVLGKSSDIGPTSSTSALPVPSQDDTWQAVEVARKLAIWGSILVIAVQLKEFTGIFMGTLVLSVVGNALVEALEHFFPGRRRLMVTLMYSVTVAVLVTLGVTKLPGAYRDAVYLLNQLQKTDLYSALSNSLRAQMGDAMTEQLESFLLLLVGKPESSIVGMTSSQQRSQALQALLKRYSGQLLSALGVSLAATSRFLLQSAVSLILSCMVVWDLPALSSSMSSLSTSRFAPFYSEIAPAVVTFGRIFRRALEAQSTIALLNTGLTLLGMLLLRIGRVVALSAIVFVCSFVPVAGVIISTVPIGLVALYEGGATKVALVVFMVVLIHAIEAYILNPFIYSAHLKLHPILTLGVLVVSEHVFGVWGLVTAVPLAVFFVDYVIYRKEFSSFEPASLPS